MKILAYDPFLSKQVADSLGIEVMELKDIIDVVLLQKIINHVSCCHRFSEIKFIEPIEEPSYDDDDDYDDYDDYDPHTDAVWGGLLGRGIPLQYNTKRKNTKNIYWF